MCEAAAGRPGSQPPGVVQQTPSQRPWEPGALRAALSHGGQTTAGEALHLPFPSLSHSSPCWGPWQCASHRPLSPPQGRLGPRCKGKAGAELRPGSRQWHLPASRRLLLPGQEVEQRGKSGQGWPWAEQPPTSNSARSGLKQSWSSAVLEAHSAQAKKGLSRTGLGCLLFPRGGSPPCLLFTRLPGGGAVCLLQVLS